MAPSECPLPGLAAAFSYVVEGSKAAVLQSFKPSINHGRNFERPELAEASMRVMLLCAGSRPAGALRRSRAIAKGLAPQGDLTTTKLIWSIRHG